MTRDSVGERIALATTRRVVRRAALTAVIVGAFLIAINQGDDIPRHDLSASRWVRMALTVLVPYLVSTVSSVQARLEAESSTSRTPRTPR